MSPEDAPVNSTQVATGPCGLMATTTSSTTDALTNLYDKLSIGGYAIIDDYAEDACTMVQEPLMIFAGSTTSRSL